MENATLCAVEERDDRGGERRDDVDVVVGHARQDREAVVGHAQAVPADFAETYADQNERDYQTLADAVSSARIEARPGL